MTKNLRNCIFLLFFFLFVTTSFAADYYVRAKAKRGKGTKERPYKGIYQALKKAVKGDVIHVAEGIYHGKLKCGYITIPSRGITLLGGYSTDFSQRNPWKFHSILEKPVKSKSRTGDMGLVYAGGDHADFVLDGFILDSATRNLYRGGSLVTGMSSRRPPVVLKDSGCVVRNCIFMNAALGGCRVSGEGSKIENCLFVNNVYYAIEVDTVGVITVSNNTIVQTWQIRTSGGYGLNIGRRSEVTLDKNIFAHSHSHAISNQQHNSNQIFRENVFHENRESCYFFYSLTDRSTLAVEDPEDLEEAEIECEDNFSEDPEFLNAAILETKKLFAPKISVDDAMTFLQVKNSELEGIGVQSLESFPIIHSQVQPKDVAKNYHEVSFIRVKSDPEVYADLPIALQAWYSEENRYYFANFKKQAFLPGVSFQTHRCLILRDIPDYLGPKGECYGYIERGSQAERYYLEKIVPLRPTRGITKNSFTVKGILKTSLASDKPMILIDSFEK